MSVEQLDTVLLLGAAVILVAIVAVRMSVGSGLPFLVIYVALGLALGPEGPSGLQLELTDPETARALGYAALVVILAEGGLTTRWSGIRPVLAPASLLATVGVLVSAGVTAAGAHLLLGLDWHTALLLGAVLAPTDSAAVFAVLRLVRLPGRTAGLLEAESGGNDASAVILVLALSASHIDASSAAHLLGEITLELTIGLAAGLLVGWAGALGLRQVALPAAGLYPLAVLSLTILAYAGAANAHGSGFLAVYVAALVLGNARLPHRPPVRAFAEGLAWLAQIFLFVMLGLLVRPSELLPAVIPALVVGLVLLLVARPASVLLCVAPFRLPWREQAFVSWAGLRGAVPIVIALIPLVQGVPDGQRILDIVFVLVIIYTLVQSPTLPWMARRLGLTDSSEARTVDVETSPLLRLEAELLELSIPQGSRLHGLEVFELRLPEGAAVALLVRDGQSFVPDRYSLLRSGDDLLVVAPAGKVSETEERLRLLAREGRLAGWYDRRPPGSQDSPSNLPGRPQEPGRQ